MGHVRLFLGSVKVVVDFNKNESSPLIVGGNCLL